MLRNWAVFLHFFFSTRLDTSTTLPPPPQAAVNIAHSIVPNYNLGDAKRDSTLSLAGSRHPHPPAAIAFPKDDSAARTRGWAVQVRFETIDANKKSKTLQFYISYAPRVDEASRSTNSRRTRTHLPTDSRTPPLPPLRMLLSPLTDTGSHYERRLAVAETETTNSKKRGHAPPHLLSALETKNETCCTRTSGESRNGTHLSIEPFRVELQTVGSCDDKKCDATHLFLYRKIGEFPKKYRQRLTLDHQNPERLYSIRLISNRKKMLRFGNDNISPPPHTHTPRAHHAYHMAQL